MTGSCSFSLRARVPGVRACRRQVIKYCERANRPMSVKDVEDVIVLQRMHNAGMIVDHEWVELSKLVLFRAASIAICWGWGAFKVGRVPGFLRQEVCLFVLRVQEMGTCVSKLFRKWGGRVFSCSEVRNFPSAIRLWSVGAVRRLQRKRRRGRTKWSRTVCSPLRTCAGGWVSSTKIPVPGYVE